MGLRADLSRATMGSRVKLSTRPANDVDPRSAAGRIVFTSDRDGNPRSILQTVSVTVSRRVTNSKPKMPIRRSTRRRDDRFRERQKWCAAALDDACAGAGCVGLRHCGRAGDRARDVGVRKDRAGVESGRVDDGVQLDAHRAVRRSSRCRVGRWQRGAADERDRRCIQSGVERAMEAPIYYTSTTGRLHLRRIDSAGGSAATSRRIRWIWMRRRATRPCVSRPRIRRASREASWRIRRRVGSQCA